MLAPVADAAASPATDPNFTFKRIRVGAPVAEPVAKRVRVPAPGTRKRITVQIGLPEPAPAPAAPRPRDPADPPLRPEPRTDYAFFWARVTPAFGPEAAARVAAAEAALEEARAGGRPLFGRPENLRAIAAAHGPAIEAAAARHGVSAALVLAVIAVESGGRNRALSPKGAQGLMQLMPGTAARFGVTDAFSAAANVAGGVAYLDVLLDMFGNDPVLALAGYNAGENAVVRNSGVPPYAETRDYVPKVLGAFLQARALCAVPAPSVRDVCILPGRVTVAAAEPGTGPR